MSKITIAGTGATIDPSKMLRPPSKPLRRLFKEFVPHRGSSVSGARSPEPGSESNYSPPVASAGDVALRMTLAAEMRSQVRPSSVFRSVLAPCTVPHN